jgi:CRP/FNR family cyclic AMP-dependent transcriptional regulator
LVEINGYAASAAVLLTVLMSTMIPLRVLALFSNALFVSYGYFNDVLPVLILHAVLFPINLYRLVQFRRLVQDVRKAESNEIPMSSLLPYMKRRSLRAGETLIRKGERVNRPYYVAEGEIEITDIQKKLQAGYRRRDKLSGWSLPLHGRGPRLEHTVPIGRRWIFCKIGNSRRIKV